MALSDRIHNKFEEWKADIFKGIGGWLLKAIGWGVQEFSDITIEEQLDMVTPTLEKVKDLEECPQEIRDLIDKILHPKSPAPPLIVLLLISAIAGGAIGATFSGPFKKLAQLVDTLARSETLDYPIVLAAYLRGEEVPWDIFDDLRKRGYSDERIELLKKLAYIVPPVPDMVRFADFSAFDKKVIDAWRDYYDSPEWIREPLKKIGIDWYWADKYWFSHWRQPGRYELGEMRRRDHIDDETVKLAYLTMGYTPFWQELLLKLVWEPYTRVDVRRMYKVGVLEREDLERAYRDLGYDEEKAKNLADFTEKYYARPPKDDEDEDDRDIARNRELTRTDITDGYRIGMLARPEATEMLSTIDYEPDEIDFYLDREDLKRDQALKDAYVSNYKQLYVTGIIEDDVVQEDLTTLGLETQEVYELLKLWRIERVRRAERPTRTDLARLLRKEIITEEQYKTEMAALGYSDKYIEWYLADLKAS